MTHHFILRVITKLLIPLILLFALYVQFHGDFGPGGGFQAGVIFAAGLVLYALVFDLDTASEVIKEWVLLLLVPLGGADLRRGWPGQPLFWRQLSGLQRTGP